MSLPGKTLSSDQLELAEQCMNRVHYKMAKIRFYDTAKDLTGVDHEFAQKEGYKDLWDLIMADAYHDRQGVFVETLKRQLEADQVQILLDGLSIEYGGAAHWYDYLAKQISSVA